MGLKRYCFECKAHKSIAWHRTVLGGGRHILIFICYECRKNKRQKKKMNKTKKHACTKKHRNTYVLKNLR